MTRWKAALHDRSSPAASAKALALLTICAGCKDPALPSSNEQVADRSRDEPRFLADDCGAIHDRWYGYSWLVSSAGPLDHAKAEAWARTTEACGSDWNLPTTEQAASLFNPLYTAGTGYTAGDKSFPARIHPLFGAIGECSWIWLTGEANEHAPAYNLNIAKQVELEAVGSKYPACAFAVRPLEATDAGPTERGVSHVSILSSRPYFIAPSATKPVVVIGPAQSASLPVQTRRAASRMLESFVSAHPRVLVALTGTDGARAREEKRRSFSACVDEQCQIELGRAASASHLLTSELDLTGHNECTLLLKLIDLEKETIAGSVLALSGKGCRGTDLADLTRAAARALLLSGRKAPDHTVVQSALADHLTTCKGTSAIRIGPGEMVKSCV